MVQKGLERLGCKPGNIDGEWGQQTRRALREFNHYAKLSLPLGGPSKITIDTLKKHSERVCPTSCEEGYVNVKNVCIKDTCPRGMVLVSEGYCEAKTVIIRKKRHKRYKRYYGGGYSGGYRRRGYGGRGYYGGGYRGGYNSGY